MTSASSHNTQTPANHVRDAGRLIALASLRPSARQPTTAVRPPARTQTARRAYGLDVRHSSIDGLRVEKGLTRSRRPTVRGVTRCGASGGIVAILLSSDARRDDIEDELRRSDQGAG